MLKGFIILITMGISHFVFKKEYSSTQKIGIMLVTIGLFFVGLSNIHTYDERCKKIFILKLLLNHY